MLRNTILFLSLLLPTTAVANEIDSIAEQLVEVLEGTYTLAVQPLNSREAKIPAGVGKALTESLTNAIQSKLSGTDLNLVDRSKLNEIMQEQQEFQGIEEFSGLLANAGADIGIFPSALRLGDDTIQLSARAVGVSSEIGGKVFAASQSIELKVPLYYTINVGGVLFEGTPKSQYESALVSGLTNEQGIQITASKSVYETDFEAISEIEYSISAEETEKSREARESKNVLKGMGGMFGAFIPKDKKKDTPDIGKMFGGFTEGTDPDAAKAIVISVSVATHLNGIGTDKNYAATASKQFTLPGDSSKERQASELKTTVRELLKQSGTEVAAKIMGRAIPTTSEKNSLLD